MFYKFVLFENYKYIQSVFYVVIDIWQIIVALLLQNAKILILYCFDVYYLS